MAGNSKPKRVVGKAKVKKAENRSALVPTVQFVSAKEELAKLHVIAMRGLNAMIDGTGNFTHWMNVLHRLYIGSVAAETYFKMDDEMVDVFNKASMAIEMIKLRAHQTGELGVMLSELASLNLALTVTDQCCRLMRLSEIRKIHDMVEDYFEEMHRQNALSYPKEDPVVADLRVEFQEVKDEAVEEIEYTAFREKELEAA